MPDAIDKVDYYMKAADLYATKFSNAAEAVKCYEAVLNLDAENTTAIEFLRQSYEKRRDWEKLIAINQREVARIEDPHERGQHFVEIAKLASEKLKKPVISIELWERVLEASPEHTEALAELEKLYEREKM